MCTVAVGVINDKKGEIKKIWEMLFESSDLLGHAVEKILDHADKTEQDAGIRDGIFDNIDTNEWIEEGSFEPNIIS